MYFVRQLFSVVFLCAVGSAASAALFDGAISAWTFDDGTVSDSIGNNDGELRGGASIAAGADGLFVEVHEDPDNAPSDGPNMLKLDDLAELLRNVTAIRKAL